jgi:hypothetical protein
MRESTSSVGLAFGGDFAVDFGASERGEAGKFEVCVALGLRFAVALTEGASSADGCEIEAVEACPSAFGAVMGTVTLGAGDVTGMSSCCAVAVAAAVARGAVAAV